MAINSDVDIPLAIEQLGKQTSEYLLDEMVPPHNILEWRGPAARPTDAEINSAWTAWKAANGDPDWNAFREQRNEKLFYSDWMAASDRTISTAQKDYRQALRDLPSNTSDPKNPTWPTPPS